MINETIISIAPVLSAKGLGCLFEKGGCSVNDDKAIGSSTIICDYRGEPKKAYYVWQGKKAEENGNHALIPCGIGDNIILTTHEDYKYSIRVYKITDARGSDWTAEKVHEFKNEKWDTKDDTVPAMLFDAIQAGADKATEENNLFPDYCIFPDDPNKETEEVELTQQAQD